MTIETKQKNAHCPHCGGDEFIVSESEVRRVRFVYANTYPHCREEIISTEGKGYESLVCGMCGCDLDGQDLAEFGNTLADLC